LARGVVPAGVDTSWKLIKQHQANLLGNQDNEDENDDETTTTGKKKKRKEKKRKRESGGDEIA
jgi:hypothetical protein